MKSSAYDLEGFVNDKATAALEKRFTHFGSRRILYCKLGLKKSAMINQHV